MNKYFSFLIAVIVFAACTSCENKESFTDIWNGYEYFNSKTVSEKLYASNSLEVGTVTYGIAQVGEYGYFTATYQLVEGWEMTETQIFAGRPEDITTSGQEGNEGAQFPHIEEHSPRVSNYTQYILCDKLPAYNAGISLAAKAQLRRLDGVEDTALAAGGIDQELLTKL